MKNKKLRKIKMALANNLSSEIQKKLGVTGDNLVALEVSVNSPATVTPVKISDVSSYWKEKIREDGVTDKQLEERIQKI